MKRRRGRVIGSRPPSVPVIDPVAEVIDAELDLDLRRIQIGTASEVYARGQSRY